jgi:hypothetical protein
MTPISGAQRTTYDAIFQHPVARNLHWAEVRSLLSGLADVVEGPDKSLKVSRNGQKLFLQRPQRNIVGVQELMDIRRFLEGSEPPAAGNSSP